MKKVPKSLQAIIVTLFFGMLLPNIFSLSGNALIDKITWKIVLTSIFSLSTFVVGLLYSSKLLKGKVAGGKARIVIYIFIIIMLCSLAMPFLVAFAEAVQWIIYLLGAIISLCIIIIIINLINKIFVRKKTFKETQNNSFKTYIKNCEKLNVTPIATKEVSQKENNIQSQQPLRANNAILKQDEEIKLFTLLELWNMRDVTKKCLTATNDENPDLKWVKVYKSQYSNGKFYGYVLMKDARNTVNGEIYFADCKIWRSIG